ncbi:hypothetical protein Tco_0904227 [Tanacetum coccineum]
MCKEVYDLQNRVEKLEVDFARAIKAKQAEHDQRKRKVHDLDNLDLENRIKKLEVDFGRMLKAKKAKEAKNDQLKVNKGFLSDDEDFVLFNDVKYLLTDAKIMMFKERPTRQVASTSTSNAQAASTLTSRGYRKIAMTGYVLGLRAPSDPNAPTSAPRKRKSKKP